MHELSLAQEIVRIVEETVAAHAGARVTGVQLRIGALQLVQPEALRFGFSATTAGTTLDGAALTIEHVPAAAHCESCRVTFEVADFVLVCPQCGRAAGRIVRGRELDIVTIDIDADSAVNGETHGDSGLREPAEGQ